ncbi:chalcone isomerase family protein [Massilia sp. DWR3-1-1]|uniref:chalcone isomerase family protein n=1 Tax=Massilia sp. DWR3-1-1 TaxID=2804559 RepID=UPI003CF69E7C
MGRAPLIAALAMLACLAACPAPALAAPAPAHIEAAVPQARVAGSGLFTYFGLKIYTAELLVGAAGYRPDAPFALDLRYERSLKGKKIAQASVEQMEKIGAGSPAQRQQWLGQMAAIFPDVVAGEHLTGINIPAVGARFYRDGVAIGAIDDVQFARAFFGIWLDPASTAPALRQALLRQAAPR